MRATRDVAIISALIALGTWCLGWWVVPLIAALTAWWDRHRSRSIAKTALAAALAWGLLLVLEGLFGASVAQLGSDLALSLGVPRSTPIVLTLLLPAVLAASAAGTVVGLTRFRAPVKPKPGSA